MLDLIFEFIMCSRLIGSFSHYDGIYMVFLFYIITFWKQHCCVYALFNKLILIIKKNETLICNIKYMYYNIIRNVNHDRIY